MKVLFYDCFSGISGDMNLGAMIDLGIEVDYLKNELNKLKLSGWELVTEKDQRHGITGTKVTVRLVDHHHGHGHHHGHTHHHHHDHEHGENCGCGHEHAHDHGHHHHGHAHKR